MITETEIKKMSKVQLDLLQETVEVYEEAKKKILFTILLITLCSIGIGYFDSFKLVLFPFSITVMGLLTVWHLANQIAKERVKMIKDLKWEI